MPMDYLRGVKRRVLLAVRPMARTDRMLGTDTARLG